MVYEETSSSCLTTPASFERSLIGETALTVLSSYKRTGLFLPEAPEGAHGGVLMKLSSALLVL